MEEKIKKELKTNRLINIIVFLISYIALAVSKFFTMYKPYLIMCFVLAVASFVVAPYLTLLFKRGKWFIAILSGLMGPSLFVIANLVNLSNFNRKFNICLIVSTLMLIGVVFIRIYYVKKANKSIKKKKEILKSFQILSAAICVIAIIFSIPVGISTNQLISKRTVVNSGIISSSIEATNDVKAKDNSFIKAYLKELTPIIDGTYKEMKLREKLDVFQRIVNIECTYYGSSVAVPIKIKAIHVADGVTYAYFSNSEEIIYLNELIFNDLAVEDALYTVLHECYHIYQHEQAKLYELVPDEYKNLAMLNSAKECKKGLDNYISGREDFNAYKQQTIEQDADAYAYSTTKEYLELIEQYSKDLDYK